jgi:hypothetical protein
VIHGAPPTSPSWINQVERWLEELTRKQLRGGILGSISVLEAKIRNLIDRTTKIRSPIDGPNLQPKSTFLPKNTKHLKQRTVDSHD